MSLKITILGCGGSMGVPVIGNDWGKCDPKNPKNRRSRASIIVEDESTRILIDSSPDLRSQFLANDIATIDAVLYTHAHADHIHGLNDLRAVCRNRGKPIDIYADTNSLKEIMDSFPYVFTPNPIEGMFFKPVLVPHKIEASFSIQTLSVQPILQNHGYTSSLGFRIGDFAYSTDVVAFEPSEFQKLKGIDVWIVDCIRMKDHPTHAHLEKTLSWIDAVKPKKAYLTHMSEDLDYESLKAILPDYVEPGYDGLILTLS